MLGRVCFFIGGEKIEKSRGQEHLLSGAGLLFIEIENLIRQLRSGRQERAYSGSGAEPGNGSKNSENRMRYSKKGHIFRYNYLRDTHQDIKGGITHVPLSILSYHEKL